MIVTTRLDDAQRPGAGFVYLAVAVVLFVGFVYYLFRRGTGEGEAGMSVAEQVLSEVFPEVAPVDEEEGKDRVVKQRSDVDNQYYYVSASLPDRKEAANKLAEVHRRSQYLLQAIDEQLDGGRRIKTDDGVDITDNMRKLVSKHYKKRIPFAEYHNPKDKTVGSNSDKGVLIEMCLRNKYKPSEWNSDNTLFRVHVHELAHSADHHFRGDGDEAHGPDFRRLMNYLLKVASNLGIYDCAQYKASGRAFCGLTLTEEDPHCTG